MDNKILHVLTDGKVVNSFISLMEEVYPDKSHYLVICNGSPKLVSSGNNVFFVNRKSKELRLFFRDISKYSHVCLHSIGGCKYYDYISHPSLSWIIWGADLYEALLHFGEGYELYSNPKEQYKVRAGKLPIFIYKFLISIRDSVIYKRELRILDKLKYIITDNECDYDVFKKYYPDKDITFLGTINYYPIESLIGSNNIGKECIGNSIWVGNSAAPNGNHLDVFKKINNICKGVKVYTPISYGDKRFTKYIAEEGYSILGEDLVALKEFLPVEEYYSLFLDSNSFVFGHYRQCGVGNILMALYFGGKVFLYNKNPLLEMYKRSGFWIFSIDDDFDFKNLMTPLTKDQRRLNRDLVMKIASYESSLMQIRNVFNRFLDS